MICRYTCAHMWIIYPALWNLLYQGNHTPWRFRLASLPGFVRNHTTQINRRIAISTYYYSLMANEAAAERPRQEQASSFTTQATTTNPSRVMLGGANFKGTFAGPLTTQSRSGICMLMRNTMDTTTSYGMLMPLRCPCTTTVSYLRVVVRDFRGRRADR